MISVQNRCETSRLRTLRTMWLMERGGSAWAGGVGTCASSFIMVSSMGGSLPPIASGQLRNHPPRRAAGGDTLDVVEAVPEPCRPVLPRRPCGMRCERDVRQREEGVMRRRWLLDHHVEPRARDLPVQQRPVERGLVHDRPAAGVDEDRARLHHRELERAEQIPRRVVEWHVQAHHVRRAKKLGEEDEADPEGVLRSEEHTSELQSQSNLVCRLLLEKKKNQKKKHKHLRAITPPVDTSD